MAETVATEANRTGGAGAVVRRWRLAAAALVVASVALLSWRGRSAAPARDDVATVSGPWGRLRTTRFFLEQPPHNFLPSLCATEGPPWILPGHTAVAARELLVSSGVEGAAASALIAEGTCDARACALRPSRELVLGLTPEVRARLYARLGHFSENAAQAYPFSRPEGDDRWRDLDDVVDPGLVERLSWRRGGDVLLSDLHLLCAAAESDAERVRVLEGLSRMTAVTAWLEVDRSTDLDALLAYWGRGTRARNLRPLVEAVARTPGGGRLDVINLVPPFVRRRLHTFPHHGDPPRDCYWSALNFFAQEQSPDVFLDPAAVLVVLARDYTAVPWAERSFGDVMVLFGPSGPAHAVNFIAADLVFSKNGGHWRRPWSLVPLAEVRDTYPDARDLRVYRLRVYPQPPGDA